MFDFGGEWRIIFDISRAPATYAMPPKADIRLRRNM
jgi:hypothetical protein